MIEELSSLLVRQSKEQKNKNLLYKRQVRFMGIQIAGLKQQSLNQKKELLSVLRKNEQLLVSRAKDIRSRKRRVDRRMRTLKKEIKNVRNGRNVRREIGRAHV